MIDWTINVPSLIGGITAIVTVVIFFARLQGRVENLERDHTVISGRISGTEATGVLLREQFHAYQLQVAREYVTVSSMVELKRDLIDEIGKMERRVEQQVDRLAKNIKAQ